MLTRKNNWLLSATSLAFAAGLFIVLITPARTGFAQAQAAGTAPSATISPKRQVELTRLVRQDCGSCHGMTLKGGLGKPLLPESIKSFSENELVDIILEGVPGTPMPPWQGLLSKDEAHWIAANLKSGSIKRGNIR